MAGSSKATLSRAGAAPGDREPSVGAELDAIFAALPRPTSPPKEQLAPSSAPRSARPRWIWFVVLIMAGLLAAAGIAFLAHPSRAPLPQPLPRPLPGRPIAAVPVPRTVINPVQPAPVAAPVANPPDRGAGEPRAAIERRRTARRTEPLRHRGRCAARAGSAWCLRGAVAAADERLRAAYAMAIRAGVDHRTLEDVQSDWSRLRRRANKDPEALIRGYGLLTQQLRAEAGRRR